jgi:tetratricopeptide (TPR) repeat protein
MPASCRRLIIGCLLVLGLNLSPMLCPPARSADEKTGTLDGVLDTKGVLALAKLRFDECSAQIEPPYAGDFARLVGVPPRFDGAFVDEAKARDLSNAAASVMLSPDAQSLGIALASAAVGHAPRLPVTAHNLAAALYLRQGPASIGHATDTSAARDAAALYRYTLSLAPDRVETWVNLGNVEMDLKQYEEARTCFEAALKRDSGCLEAHVGMATYWFAKGDKQKAQDELQSGQIRYPASTRKTSEANERLEDPDVAPQVMPSDEIETMEEKLRKLRELTPMSTADIIEPFDPEDAQQIRIKVNNLPQTDLLRLPELTSITMFGTYEAYYKHRVFVRLYQKEVEAFFKKWSADLKEQSKKIVTDLGGTITTDARGKTQLGGTLDKAAMKAEAARMRQMAKNGQIAELMQEVSQKYDPQMLQMPGVAGMIGGQAAASPPSLDGYLASYNFQVFNKKYVAWIQYWPKYVKRETEFLMERAQRGNQRIQELRDAEGKALEELRNRCKPDSPPESEIVQIELNYLLQRNQERESWFHDSFDAMVLEYKQRIRPNLEAMWTDLLPHVRLMQAGMSRDRRFTEVGNLALSMSAQLVGMVAGSANVGEWEDPAVLRGLQAELEQARLRQKEADEQAARSQIPQDFARANAPGRFSPEALLDQLSWKKSLGPISFKITASSIEISGSRLIEGSLSYNWRTDVVKGYLGVGCSFSTGDAPIGAGAALGTGVSFTYNAQTGKVAEIDWTASASATANLGVVSASTSYEASVMHGNTLTVDVTSTVGRPTSLYHDSMPIGQ